MSEQPHAAPHAGPHHTDRRPGTVTAAAVTTLVLAGLTLLLFVLTLIGMLAAREEFVSAIEREPSFAETGIDVDDAFGLVVGVVGFLALWCVVACVLAVLALRRSNGGRIALVVSASLSALVSLVAIGSLVSVVPLVASVAVVVLLFTGGANDWYARRAPGGQGGHGQQGPPSGWSQQGQQWSQQYGASAAPYGSPYGQPTAAPGPPTYPQHPGPVRPDSEQPSTPPPGQQPGQQPGEPGRQPGEPGDDRPVQKPWG